MNVKPNLVIVGPGRCGTTSLFRSLALHPDICVSQKKETGRYREVIFRKDLGPFSDYQQLFSHHKGERWVMEATPGYFYGGKKVAEVMRAELGEIKIIIVVRDPAERAYSLYNHVRAKQNLSCNESFGEYIENCESFDENMALSESNIRYSCLKEGEYGRLIREWEQVFGLENVLVLNFDDLQSCGFNKVARFLSINEQVAEAMNHDNKTVSLRNKRVHLIAQKINQYLEPVLLRYPRFRKIIVSGYYFFNGRAPSRAMSESLRQKIHRYYAEDYMELRRVADERGLQIKWLKVDD